MNITPGVALAKATFRSYTNALSKACRANPLLAAITSLTGVTLLLLVTAFQLQAVVPLLSSQSLGTLAQAQVDDVARASLTALAAIGWGLALLIQTLGLQSSGLLSVAATRGVGAVNRAIGREAPTVIAAAAASLGLIGPASFAGVYRCLEESGAKAPMSAALSVVVLLCVATASATSALAIPAGLELIFKRDRDTPGLKAAATALSGGLLITGIGLVLARKTWGLYILAIPTLTTAGVPNSVNGATAVVVGTVVWSTLCIGLGSRRMELCRSNDGIPLRLRSLRLPNTLSTLELRQIARDTVLTCAMAVTFTGSLAVGLLYRGGTLDRVHADLLVLAVVGLSSLSSCMVGFRTATTSWLYVTRSDAYKHWYYAAIPAVLARTVLLLAISRALTTLPADLGK